MWKFCHQGVLPCFPWNLNHRCVAGQQKRPLASRRSEFSKAIAMSGGFKDSFTKEDTKEDVLGHSLAHRVGYGSVMISTFLYAMFRGNGHPFLSQQFLWILTSTRGYPIRILTSTRGKHPWISPIWPRIWRHSLLLLCGLGLDLHRRSLDLVLSAQLPSARPRCGQRVPQEE
jgi:hypothetical protein